MIKDKNGNEIIVGMYINEHPGKPMYLVTKIGDGWARAEVFLTAEEIAELYEFIAAE